MIMIIKQRIKAHEMGYVGCDAPQLNKDGEGALQSVFVTVYRMVEGVRCAFAGAAYALDHASLARPVGDLAELAELDALQKAFPFFADGGKSGCSQPPTSPVAPTPEAVQPSPPTALQVGEFVPAPAPSLNGYVEQRFSKKTLVGFKVEGQMNYGVDGVRQPKAVIAFLHEYAKAVEGKEKLRGGMCSSAEARRLAVMMEKMFIGNVDRKAKRHELLNHIFDVDSCSKLKQSQADALHEWMGGFENGYHPQRKAAIEADLILESAFEMGLKVFE